MKLLKLILIMLGALLPIGYSAVLTITHILAYFNNYKITVLTNTIGEAHIELFILLVSIPIMLWATFTLLKHYIKNLNILN